MAALPPMDFVQRFQALQLQRNTSNEIIKDLLIYCERVEGGLRQENELMVKELKDTQLDLNDERKSMIDLQHQLNLVTQRMGQYNAHCDSMRNRNAYIMVLIDGDGVIFNENLIRQGIEGGKQAANALRNSILEHCSATTDEIEIIAKIYANITGLSNALGRDGSLEKPDDLRDFTLGFTQAKASFDFIDVGHGKERADSKIKECMRWHLRNHNCKQILLGISHDAGYAPFLNELITPDDHCRMTIIEGPPTVRELSTTGLQILNLTNIFRPEKLVDRLVSFPTLLSTWAGVAPNSPPQKTAFPVTVKQDGVKKPTPSPAQPKAIIPWVPGPRGLDPPITVDATVLDKIKRRTKNNKLCNNHYLRGPCAKGNECSFEHDYTATEEDIKAVALLARLNRCLNGQDCELEFCIYGHHCPSVTMGGKGGAEPVCMAFGCRFEEEDHPPRTVIKHPRKDRWDKEYEQ